MFMRVLLAMAVTVGLGALLACGPAASTCVTEGATVEILDNHRTSGGDHKLEVPAADVSAGEEKTYDIRGDNTGHTHSVTVTADHFTTLQEGRSVDIQSSDTGAAGNDHTHTVRLDCPDPA